MLCTIASKINGTAKDIHLPIITYIKFVTAVKLYYKVLQFFRQSDTLGGNIYFACDGTLNKKN